MIPYADFNYWGLLLFPALPTLLVGWGRRLRQVWLVLATAAMLVIQYSADRQVGHGILREVWLVGACALYQLSLAQVFCQIRRRTRAGWLAWAAVGLALAPLLVGRAAPAYAPAAQVGFLGISYLTFRALDVVIGIHDGLIRGISPGAYLAYLLFFPTISAGPIDRYRRFVEEWLRSRSRSEVVADLDAAVHHVFTGFLYKFVLAELIRRHWLEPAGALPGWAGTVAYMYAYSLYLFFDFAGYSAFAIGVGCLFGIHTPINFRRPFLARDIRDFWNRWHISLSWWFRDHVYMRFVMAATRRRWFGNRYVASYLGFTLSMGLMGVWHGFALHYIVYGAYHAALLIGHDVFSRWNRSRQVWGDSFRWRAAGILLTSQAVCFGFLIFSGRLFAA